MSNQSELISEDINAYLKQHEHKELLRLLTCGSVDDGKSTLIGRLLHDSKMIYEDQLEAIKADSIKSGTNDGELDLALLVDGLQAEREQGITIDVAYRFFSTSRRKFIIADTPGHEQYTRNMATGASTAQLAIILIDARHGVLTQTRRHSFIASLLGIQHVVVAINKMDIVDFSEDRYNEIKNQYLEFSKDLNIKDLHFTPISALKGDNVVSSSENMPWFTGKPLMELLETVEIAKDKNLTDFRMPVQYVNRPNLNFRGFCGTIAAGTIKPGEEIIALPSGLRSTVKEIVTFEGAQDEAFIDQAITLTLNDEIDISRGDIIAKPGNTAITSQHFDAHIVWMAETPLKQGKLYDLKLATHNVSATIQSILHTVNVNTLEKDSADELPLNSIGLCRIHSTQPVVFDPYQDIHGMGAFIIIDRLTNVTIGAGMIRSAVVGLAEKEWTAVSPEERAARYSQKPCLINCTGKESDLLATAVERQLFDAGKTPLILDSSVSDKTVEVDNMIHLMLNAGFIVILSTPEVTPGADLALSADDEASIATALKDLPAFIKNIK
jgi:bifunctional enzyme CysN/CysC/sulfate adenylyltransferase subunit 1